MAEAAHSGAGDLPKKWFERFLLCSTELMVHSALSAWHWWKCMPMGIS